MAKTLAAFTKEFRTIEDAVKFRGAFAVEYQRKRIRWPGFSRQHLAGIRARARDLRATGQSLNQVRQDRKIRDHETQLHTLDKDVAETKIFVKAWGKPTHERTTTLENDMQAEIAKRRKELKTKLGVGNKSLPDMEALLANLKRFKSTARYKAVVGMQVEDYNFWQTHIDMLVTDEIEKGLAGK